MAEARALQVDRDACLVSGDAQLLSLNARAGGAIGQPLALPALDAVVRLAMTLAMPIARTVLVADNDADREFRVEVRPTAEGAALTAEATASRISRTSRLAAPPATPEVAVAQSWQWQTDARLIVTRIDGLAGDFAGQPLTRIVRLLENADGDLPLLTALAAHSAVADQRAVRRDQPDVEIVLRADPVNDANGHFVGYSGQAGPRPPDPVVVEPVADPQFTRRLEQALRAPLDRIVAGADSIAAQTDGPLRRDYADYAGDIASAARHLLTLVDDLADLDAIERPDFAVEGEAIDLADLARRAAGLLSVRAADRNVRIDRPATDETLAATGDFRRVLQILVNLIGNAVRYSPPGAMVWLRIERDHETAVVIVADLGKGIDVADQARIFDKFERVDPGEAGGSGLGLYISRRLARAMGGDITVDSAPGQGARFVLTLPAA